jgi:hypothetical protein
MNKVKNLKKTYSFQYKYEVEGCIFTIEHMPLSGTWVLNGYDSQQDLDEFNYFIELSDSKKKYLLDFLKFTFNRCDY